MALALCGLVAGGAYFVVGHALELAHGTLKGSRPVSNDSTAVTFRVESGADRRPHWRCAAGARSHPLGPGVSGLLVEQEGVGGRLAAGEYELSPSMSAREVVAALAGGGCVGGSA